MKPLLAQGLLQSPYRHDPVVARVVRALTVPWEGNHVPVCHPALAKILSNEAEQCATIYCLDANNWYAAAALMNSPRRRKHISEFCQAPHTRMFFEWEHEDPPGRLGIFVEGDRSQFSFVLFVDPGGAGVVRPRFMCEWSFDDPGSTARVLYFCDGKWSQSPSRSDLLADVGLYVQFIAAVWMFVGIGGATVHSHRTTREGRLLARRGKHRGPPAIFSYNTCRLAIPQGEFARHGVIWTRGPGVRRHEVHGHWRELNITGAKVLRWIAAYFRGNSDLGFVLKTKH